ncbi:MAG: hypothetical protein BMS9Abin05_1983 [Rhodothermia bacterium]|nr:MAG: hypothetical protein BMS9Abin05_1983 [Rhodothermia bacterium]
MNSFISTPDPVSAVAALIPQLIQVGSLHAQSFTVNTNGGAAAGAGNVTSGNGLLGI